MVDAGAGSKQYPHRLAGLSHHPDRSGRFDGPGLAGGVVHARGHDVAIRALHSFFKVNVSKMHGFAEAIGVVERNDFAAHR